MRFALLIAAAAAAILAAPAGAETVTKASKRSTHTVVTSRDETGRTRTKIIVEKRSFLDPGKEVFPGERRYNDGPWLVWQPTFTNPQENTITMRRYPLPDRFDLSFSSSNPFGGPP